MKKIYLYKKNNEKKTGLEDNNAYWSSLTHNNCISNGICTSGIVPTAVVGILSTLINVCNKIYSMICATMIVGGENEKIYIYLKKLMKKIYLY